MDVRFTSAEVSALAQELAVQVEADFPPHKINSVRVDMILHKLRLPRTQRPSGMNPRGWSAGYSQVIELAASHGAPEREELQHELERWGVSLKGG